jgi:phage portal protein BeeE
MNLRHKLGRAIAGKSGLLTKEDFGDWEAYVQAYGGKKKSGVIPWNAWSAQRREYRGTTYACIRKIAQAVAGVPLHLYVPEGSGAIRDRKRIPVSDESKAFLSEQSLSKLAVMASESVEEVTDHPALDVFKRANGSMTRFQLFDRTMVDMGLNGNSYWELVSNKTDEQNRCVPGADQHAASRQDGA